VDNRARLDRLRGLLLVRASQAARQPVDTDYVRLCAGLADGLPGMLVSAPASGASDRYWSSQRGDDLRAEEKHSKGDYDEDKKD
jgi:hypothetical protein